MEEKAEKTGHASRIHLAWAWQFRGNLLKILGIFIEIVFELKKKTSIQRHFIFKNYEYFYFHKICFYLEKRNIVIQIQFKNSKKT